MQPSAESPSPETLVARARAMIPTLRDRAAETIRAGRLPERTIQELRDAGLFRVLQPRARGGYEMHPNVFYDVIIALGQGDMSVAWCYGVIACHAWQLALFDVRAAEEVWGRDDGALVSSSYMLAGRGVPTEGGYRLSGRWRFSSGSEHCEWAFLGGVADPESGKNDARTFLLPRSDYRIETAWNVGGLRGTGSQDVVVEDAFVPEHRTHRIADGTRCKSPGNAVHTGPLYRIPFAQIFVRAVSTPAIGALQGMLDEFVAYGRVKASAATGAKTAENPSAQLACARTRAAIAEMTLVLHATMERLYTAAESHEAVGLDERLVYRFQSSDVSERCLALGQELFKSAGGSAAYDEQPFGQRLADLGVGRLHAANQQDAIGRNLGGFMLGRENREPFY